MSTAIPRSILLLGTLWLATACGKQGPPLATGEVTQEEAVCRTDKECTLMPDCCGCDQGGMQMGVHVDMVEHAKQRQQSECTARTCAGGPSQHKSCGATEARCLGGRCIPAL